MVALMCDGEIAETADRFLVSTSVRRYLRRIAEKTALLFSLAFQVGARESGAPAPVAAALRRLGWCLGMAFQIVDDILDFDAGSRGGRQAGGERPAAGNLHAPGGARAPRGRWRARSLAGGKTLRFADGSAARAARSRASMCSYGPAGAWTGPARGPDGIPSGHAGRLRDCPRESRERCSPVWPSSSSTGRIDFHRFLQEH